jgi:hypothetical protein
MLTELAQIEWSSWLKVDGLIVCWIVIVVLITDLFDERG